VSSEAKKHWLAPGFVIAAVILAAAAVGLNTAVSALQLKFQKAPVPHTEYRHLLDTIPDRLGDWVQGSKDEPLNKEIQDALGTEQYIFRDYVNTAVVPDVSEFKDKSSTERKIILARIETDHPGSTINCGVTYYTGLVDTVAHIPERCYIADGYQPTETPDVISIALKQPHLGPKPADAIGMRFINFEDQTAAGRITRQVGYFFFTNGHYESDPIGVRTTLQDLRAKHGFYSKVELMTLQKDPKKAQQTMSDFLSAAVPEIERCMPDWNRVEGGGGK